MADLDRVVRVSTSTRPVGVARRVQGRTLFLTTDDALDGAGSGKIASFSTITDVGGRFATTSEPYKAAQVYFGRSPYPRNLVVGRWAQAAVNHAIRGGAPATVATLQAINTGSFSVGGQDFTGLNLSAAADYAGVAAALQTLIRTNAATGFSTATVSYSAAPQRFVVEFPPGAAVAAVFGPHSAGTGVDVSGSLGLDADSGATFHPGSEAETIAAALDAIERIDDSWGQFMIDAPLNGSATMLAAGQWAIGTGSKLFFAESNEAAALVANETGSFAAQLAALGSNRTPGIITLAPDYKAASLAAIFSAVDPAQPDSAITAFAMNMPGTTPDNYTDDERAEIDRKRWNHYTTIDGDPILAEGVTMASGGWIDVTYFLDWFQYATQVEVYNLIRAQPKVAQTNAGLALLANTAISICRQALRGGWIAPNVVSAAMAAEIRLVTGNNDFDGRLTNGYLVYPGRLSDQTQTQREARGSPPVNEWLKGSGAIHDVDIALVFEG